MGARVRKFLFAFCSGLGSFALCFCLLTALAWGKVIDPSPDYMWVVLLSAALWCAVVSGALEWLFSGSKLFGWAVFGMAGGASLMWLALSGDYWFWAENSAWLGMAVLTISMTLPPLILGVIWGERLEVKA